ncbi:MAG: hypothetical protein LUF01_14495 [Bacteroides sp.]|nr:hypothetical protein [Bacteroides sp.]
MNISDKIALLKANIASAISSLRENLTGKGVVVEDNETLTTLVGKVNDIQQGGSIDALMEQCGYSGSVEYMKRMILRSYEHTKDKTDYNNFGNSGFQMVIAPDINTPVKQNFSFREQAALKIVPEIDCSNISTLFYAFHQCRSLEEVHFVNLDLDRLTLGNAFSNAFNQCYCLKKITGLSGRLKAGITFSDCFVLDPVPYLDTSQLTNMNYYFPRSSAATQETLPEVDMSSIPEGSTTEFGATNYKIMAKNMSFAGIIRCNLRMYGDNYTRETMLNLFEHLYDYTGGTTHTVEIGSVSLARLSDDDKAIAINKNWTLI